MTCRLSILTLLTLAAPWTTAAEIASSGFDPDDSAMPWVWGGGDNITVVENADGHHLEIAHRTQGHSSMLTAMLPIDPAWSRLAVRVRMRSLGLKTGSESWQDGRLAVHFTNEDGSLLGYGRIPRLDADVDWMPLGADMDIPAGAAGVQIICAHFGAGGMVAFDDVRIDHDPQLDALPLRDGVAADFETLDDDGRPHGWFLESRFQVAVTEDGNRFLRLIAPGFGEARAHVALPVDAQRIRITCRLRASELVGGGSPEQTARVDYEFLGADGRKVLQGQQVPSLAKDTPWQDQAVETAVPAQAASLLIRVRNGASAGTFDFDDLRIEALSE